MAMTENIKVRVDDDMRDMLERIAAREDRTVGAIVRRAIRAYAATTNGNQPDATEDAA